MTDEQLKQFAEACGWRLEPTTFPVGFYLTRNPGNHPQDATAWRETKQVAWECLPDFLHSKDAVIEALERFCKERSFLFEVGQQSNGGYYVAFDHMELSALTFDSDVFSARGDTLNEAIILAVLSAPQSPKPKEGSSDVRD